MKVIDWNSFVENGTGNSNPVSFTIGVFDGLHLGHRELMKCLTDIKGNIPVVATFVSNPFLLLRPAFYKGDISTIKQKIDLLEACGCGYLILIDFSLEFSKLSGRDFFDIVRNHLNISHLVLGKNHKLGNRGDTSAEQAKYMLGPDGICVDIVEPLIDNGKPVSSTRIRTAVENGDFVTVNRLLGRKHTIDIHNSVLIKDAASPYIRRNDINQVIPFTGVYAVTLVNGEKTFATKIKFIEDRIEFEKTPDFQAEMLTFNR